MSATEPIPGNKEQKLTAETLKEFNKALKKFLDACPIDSENPDPDGGIISARTYDMTMPDVGGGYFQVSAVALAMPDAGVINIEYAKMHHGSQESGPDMYDDFHFTIEDSAVWRNERREFTFDDETGELEEEYPKSYYFHDSEAIEKREQEILDGQEIIPPAPLPNEILLPNLKTTDAGDIYQDGEILSSHSNPVPGLGISMGFSFRYELDRMEQERKWAAERLAEEQVGTGLTEDRAQRIIGLLTEAYFKLPLQ
jgi:hypothetical protein